LAHGPAGRLNDGANCDDGASEQESAWSAELVACIQCRQRPPEAPQIKLKLIAETCMLMSN
jgi:hypothetical protein